MKKSYKFPGECYVSRRCGAVYVSSVLSLFSSYLWPFSYQGTVTFTEDNFSLPVTDIRAQTVTFKSSGARYKTICRTVVSSGEKGHNKDQHYHISTVKLWSLHLLMHIMFSLMGKEEQARFLIKCFFCLNL